MRCQQGWRDLGTKVAARANTCTVFQLTTDFDTWSIDCNRPDDAIRAIRPVPDTSAIYVRGLSCPHRHPRRAMPFSPSNVLYVPRASAEMNVPDDSGENFSGKFYEFLLPNLLRFADERANLRNRNFKVARAGALVKKQFLTLVSLSFARY